MSEQTEALAVVAPTVGNLQTNVPVGNISVSAQSADEMTQAQSALIQWTEAKLKEAKEQTFELAAATEHAIKQKWSSATLKRHTAMAGRRVQFYEKLLIALEHGYQIVPPFPVTLFAIRTDKTKPLKLLSDRYWDTHEQKPEGLPAGEGDYRNPFPVVFQRTIKAAEPGKSGEKNFWAEAWKDLEFPVTMAKPQIMEATTRAMALGIFDDLGILPVKKHEDPVIVARIRIPSNSPYQQRTVSFIIAWHLDTRSITA